MAIYSITLKTFTQSAPDSILKEVLAIQSTYLAQRDDKPQTGFLISSWTLDELQSLLSRSQLIVASESHQVVGYALLTDADEFFSYLEKPESTYIPTRSIALQKQTYLYQVAARSGTKGVGRMLLEEAKKQAGPKGLFADILTEPLRNDRSLKFFADQGFQSIGRLTLSNYRSFGQLKSDVLSWKPDGTSSQ